MRLVVVSIILILAAVLLMADYPVGTTACPSSGSTQVSSTGYQLYQITVLALSTNSGTVYLGSTSAVTTSTGFPLIAGASYTATKPNPGVNPQSMWFACSNSADSIKWIGSR